MAGTYHSWLSRRSKIPHKWLKLVGHSFGLYIYIQYIYIWCTVYIYRYDVLYTYIWCNVYSKGSEFGYNGIYVFIYLSINVCIYISCKSRKLVASSFKQAFFFLPQEQIISHCQFWDGLKLRTSQRNCGPAAFGLFLCFILGCWNGKGICKDLQASTSVPVCSDCWTNMNSPLRSLRPKTPFQNVRSKILNITEAKK